MHNPCRGGRTDDVLERGFALISDATVPQANRIEVGPAEAGTSLAQLIGRDRDDSDCLPVTAAEHGAACPRVRRAGGPHPFFRRSGASFLTRASESGPPPAGRQQWSAAAVRSRGALSPSSASATNKLATRSTPEHAKRLVALHNRLYGAEQARRLAEDGSVCCFEGCRLCIDKAECGR